MPLPPWLLASLILVALVGCDVKWKAQKKGHVWNLVQHTYVSQMSGGDVHVTMPPLLKLQESPWQSWRARNTAMALGSLAKWRKMCHGASLRKDRWDNYTSGEGHVHYVVTPNSSLCSGFDIVISFRTPILV